MKFTAGKFLFAGLLLLTFASCEKNIDTEATAFKSSASTSQQEATSSSAKLNATTTEELVKAVFSANARYHSTVKAVKDGYQPDDHCVAVPGLGGMGYHWVNPSLVDATFDPLKPEVLLYAKDADGELRLIAVEYIVINAGQATPVFGNQPFEVGGTPVPAPHWSLHAWIFEPNPSGMFAPFNPNISCR